MLLTSVSAARGRERNATTKERKSEKNKKSFFPLCTRREYRCVCVCVCGNDILFFLSLVVNGVDDCDKMCGVLCGCCIFVLVCSKAVSKRNHATEFVFARQE